MSADLSAGVIRPSEPSPASVRDDDDLAILALRALLDSRELAIVADDARRVAAEARDAAAYALSEAGWTMRRIGAELDCSHTLAHRMVKAHRDRVWGGFEASYSATPSLQQLAEEYRVARHAQELRAEAAGASVKGSDERKAFFGSESVAAADHAESALTWKAWMRHRSDAAQA